MNTEKTPIYPVEPWTITETEFRIENNYRNETTFALSNGYIGTRGTFEEAYPFDVDTGLEGNFINGFYESEKIRYGEANFGSPLWSQSLLNLPNLKETRVRIDGIQLPQDVMRDGTRCEEEEHEWFDMRAGTVEDYRRTLHMRDGILSRSLVWTSPRGRKLRIEIRRLASFRYPNILAIRYCVTPLNFSGRLTFLSRLDGNVENHTRKTNPIVDYGPFGRRLEPIRLYTDGTLLYYEGRTGNSHLTVACGSIHKTGILAEDDTANIAEDVKESRGELDAQVCFSLSAEKGNTYCLEKFICYASDLDMPRTELEPFVRELLRQAADEGYASLEVAQKQYFHRLWESADVQVQEREADDAGEALQQGIRFNLFHVLQAAGRNGRTGLGAKGLTGEGYEGHYFWDTEMYMLPLFVYTEPETARKLLEYRYHTLPQARERARILGHEKGALYPWRTINGQEASTYYPLGTAQYHINADIAYAVSLYLQATGDLAFFREMGAEILIETARVWADVGSFAECRDGRYCICSVTGPDEYNVLVDNNFYTNLMAREHLRDAIAAVNRLREAHSEEDRRAWRQLAGKLHFTEDEPELWQKIIDRMYFPYDEKRKVYPLDDGFLMRKPWEENRIPPEKRAWLYENYHPLFIMRHRMSKQADAILGMYLYSHLFTREELERNYEFYQEVTLHHSSLSTCIFGIVACGIGRHEEAFAYFTQSARMDLDDYHNNFYAGIHGANMAGTWQTIVNGFAGLRCHGGKLHFEPYLPGQWKRYCFRLRFRGSALEIEVRANERQEGACACFTLLEGDTVAFYVNGKEITLGESGGRYIENL